MPAKEKVHSEYLEYHFSIEEHMELSKEMARESQAKRRKEEQKVKVMSQFKAELDELTANINRLSELVSNGYEYRNVECAVMFDYPSRGKKRIVRKDTGEWVKDATMTSDELQQQLDFAEQLSRDLENAPVPEPSQQWESESAPPEETHGEEEPVDHESVDAPVEEPADEAWPAETEVSEFSQEQEEVGTREEVTGEPSAAYSLDQAIDPKTFEKAHVGCGLYVLAVESGFISGFVLTVKDVPIGVNMQPKLDDGNAVFASEMEARGAVADELIGEIEATLKTPGMGLPKAVKTELKAARDWAVTYSDPVDMPEDAATA